MKMLKAEFDKSRTTQITAVLLIYPAIQVTTRSQVLLNGRFLAEEGSFWWAHTLEASAFSILFFVPPLTGYFLFNTNLTFFLWQWLPMTYLPLATTWTSLVIQVQPAFIFLLLTKERSWRFRFLGFALLLFSPIFSDPETFANSINSQTYLAIISMLYLVLWKIPESKTSKLYVGFFLFIGFFSGWYSAILWPLFFLRYWFGRRSKFYFFVTTSSIIAFLFQGTIYLYQKQANLLWPNKGELKLNFYDVMHDQFSIIRFVFTGSQGLSDVRILPLICLVIISLVILKLVFGNLAHIVKSAAKDGKWLISAFVIEYCLVYVGDASPGLGLSGRYLLVPSSALLLIFIFVFLEKGVSQLDQLKFYLLVLFLPFMSFFQYFDTSSSSILNCQSPCISWRENIVKVQAGKSSAYYFWPYKDGNPDWAISSKFPKVRLAPFQAEAMGWKSEYLPPISSIP